jgi:CHAP domain/Putative peptidoglycan binding domain
MSAVSRILSVARAELGYAPKPSGWTKFGDWYAKTIAKDPGFATAEWCDMFVSWCAHQAGVGGQVGQFAYTPYHATFFNNHHHWKGTPRVGAVVFFDWGGSHKISNIDHVALVEQVGADGSIVVLEGNAGEPSKVRRTRYSSYIAGYGYPHYPADGGGHAPPFPGQQFLHPGATNEFVTMLQRKLHDLGYQQPIGSPQGTYGPVTQANVKAFQAKRPDTWGSVPHPTGIAGPKTWQAIFAATKKP